ncbi:hypothetical protein FDG96_gp71 [Bacillus phage Mgbh1]|uniref:Uncharacterized protein n=1 Tax=Bacillus phage Mgbh1 TaxID=1796993 RepID=A0A142F1S3_9CAUD|nr:hypothetical protein FDG96_gp71 [Bacillus phage Mgbh1]AMQ66730.1 hypothetical protein [Bacillus phage Mgbh1]
MKLMNQSELHKMAGMMSKIAYEMRDMEGVNEELREMLLEFWRQFSVYEHLGD